jgi:hypothetical protein
MFFRTSRKSPVHPLAGVEMRICDAVRHNHFDAVLINGIDMLWAVNELSPEMPTVLIAHYLEHQLLV